MIAAGKPPATFQAHFGPEMVSYALAAPKGVNSFVNFTPIVKKTGLFSSAVKQVLLAGSFNGTMLSMPVNVHRGSLLYINLKILKKYNLPIPRNLSTLTYDTIQLEKHGIHAWMIPGADGGWDQLNVWEDIFLALAGPKLYNEFMYGVLNTSSPQVQSLINETDTLFLKYASTDYPGWQSMTWTQGITGVIKGNAVFEANGNWLANYAYDFDKVTPYPATKPYIDWSNVTLIEEPFPGTQSYYALVIDSVAVPKGPYEQAGLKFATWFSSFAGQKVWTKWKAVTFYKNATDWYNTPAQWYDYKALLNTPASDFVYQLSDGGLYDNVFGTFISQMLALQETGSSYVPTFNNWVKTLVGEEEKDWLSAAKIGLGYLGMPGEPFANFYPPWVHVTTKPVSAAPKYITIGTLYSSTGSFADTSMSEYDGLKLWASWINSQGGIYVKQYGKKIPVKIIAYDDHSSPTTAESLYQELVKVDHVDVLIADFGSVLTAPAVSFANASHVLLIDVTGSSYRFFHNNNYIVLTSLPVSPYFIPYVAPFLHSLNITKVAVIYAANDFNAYQDYFLGKFFKQYGITTVLNESYPTSTTDFSSYIATIKSSHPQAVLELGYPDNDIAFLNQLASSKTYFPLVLTNFPGQMLTTFAKSVGVNMNGTFTLAYPPLVSYKVNYGPTLSEFEKIWNTTYPGTPYNFLSIAGFNAGLIVGLAIQDAGTLNQTTIKQAILNDISGKVVTLDGPFKVTQYGMQIGEIPLPAQVWVYPNGTTTVVLLWPSNMATGKPIYPNPYHP